MSPSLFLAGQNFAFLVLVVSFLVSLTSSCFITNCPPGGKKRSGSHGHLKQCTSCGPDGVGRCFSPSLCCSPLLGCYFNTPESRACAGEDRSPVPCTNNVASCKAVERGQCVMRDYCCNDLGACRPDPQCGESNQADDTETSIFPTVNRNRHRLTANHMSPQPLPSPIGHRLKDRIRLPADYSNRRGFPSLEKIFRLSQLQKPFYPEDYGTPDEEILNDAEEEKMKDARRAFPNDWDRKR